MTHAACVVFYLAVFLSGTIGGLLFGTAIEQQQLTVLAGPAWVQARHSIDAVFSRLLPHVWNGALILLFVSAYMAHAASRWCFLTAGLLLLVGIVVTLVIEVPINKQIASWTADNMAANWIELRAKWVRFHWVRTVMGMAAFAFAVAAIIIG
jgi:uncharacterized membrane protein